MKLFVIQLLLSSLLLLALPATSQSTTSETFKENRWNLNTNINLPAARFHLVDNNSDIEEKGFLELFSSFGVGISMNYGKAKFVRDLANDRILEEFTEFSNIVGLQAGVLYSSQVGGFDASTINSFSIYGGINILDLQLGGGYEFGSRFEESNGWFLAVSYGIPVYKLTGDGSYMFKKRKKNKSPTWGGNVASL